MRYGAKRAGCGAMALVLFGCGLGAATEAFAACSSQSVGTPVNGTLRGGREMPRASAHHVVQPFAVRHELRWATCRLVDGLLAVAREVTRDRRLPLVIGNLSQKGGGEMKHSASHESGRDVDIAFQVADERGRARFPVYHRFDSKLESRSHGPRYRFDVARNWQIVAALLRAPHFEIERIVIAPYLRAALLDHAQTHGEDAAMMALARTKVVPPWPGVKLHDNHFHVRIACDPSTEPRCREVPLTRAIASNARGAGGAG